MRSGGGGGGLEMKLAYNGMVVWCCACACGVFYVWVLIYGGNRKEGEKG